MTEIIVAAIPVVGMLLALLLKQGHDRRATQGQLETIRRQVQNSHGTNLRDDIDRIRDAINEVRGDVRGIRIELRDVRREVGDIRDADDEAEREHRRIWDTLRRILPSGNPHHGKETDA